MDLGRFCVCSPPSIPSALCACQSVEGAHCIFLLRCLSLFYAFLLNLWTVFVYISVCTKWTRCLFISHHLPPNVDCESTSGPWICSTVSNEKAPSLIKRKVEIRLIRASGGSPNCQRTPLVSAMETTATTFISPHSLRFSWERPRSPPDFRNI